MANEAPKILVTGAGITGGEVIRHLIKGGNAPRVLVRNPDKAAPFAKLGAEIVKGDFAEPESWDTALLGVEKVFLITPSHPQAGAWFTTFLEAAKRARPGQIVRLSGWRVSPSSEALVHQAMGRMDDALLSSGLPHTILRPNVFFQNMLLMAKSIQSQSRFQSAVGDAHISMIDVRDVAAVAVKILSEGGHLGKIYDMSGPDSLTYTDVARILSEVLGRTITYVALDEKAAIVTMVQSGQSGESARARVNLHRSFSNGVFTPTSDTVETILGRPPIPFSRFASDYADSFR